MMNDSIICGNSTGRDRGSNIIAVKSILSAGNDCKCSITCGSAGGDGLIVERSQCDESASDNLTAGCTSGISFITESASCRSLTTGSAGGIGGGCAGGGGGGGGGCGD